MNPNINDGTTPGPGQCRELKKHCWHFSGKALIKFDRSEIHHETICCHCGYYGIHEVSLQRAQQMFGYLHGPAHPVPPGTDANAYPRIQ